MVIAMLRFLRIRGRTLTIAIVLLASPSPGTAFLSPQTNLLANRQIVRPISPCCWSSCRTEDSAEAPASCDRKEFLSALGAASILLLPSAAEASTDSLDATLLGPGQWIQRSSSSSRNSRLPPLPPRRRPLSPTFVTYSTRFMIRYDPNLRLWWNDREASVSLLSDEKKEEQLGRAFGTLAKSLQTAFAESDSTASLFGQFVDQYGKLGPEVERQLALLFALLPPDQQPVASLDTFYNARLYPDPSPSNAGSSPVVPTTTISDTAALFRRSLTMLLTEEFHIVKEKRKDSYYYTIEPFLPLFEIGIDKEGPATASYATLFGPLAATPLTRDNPVYGPLTYALLGLAGSTGCALTHATVIPLDVVKTRAQTEGTSKGNLLVAASRIAQTEGPVALFLGAQATIIGYVWYGLSVYPCYAFFKRAIGLMILPTSVSMAHANEVALVAGALASVVASFGLTPLEAARIRVVADPDMYRPLGVMGTLRVIATTGQNASPLGSLYAGLPSLLTRQVIFGSVKFLAFEKACEVIFSFAPVLSEATWTSLIVSLAAGGFSGVLSSVVSQPADSLLTYVAKGDREMGLWEGAQTMIAEDGPGSLFRGLGSRCVWAGSIIAGQFFLYDIFRTYFGVSSEDLSQVFELHLNGQG